MQLTQLQGAYRQMIEKPFRAFHNVLQVEVKIIYIKLLDFRKADLEFIIEAFHHFR